MFCQATSLLAPPSLFKDFLAELFARRKLNLTRQDAPTASHSSDQQEVHIYDVASSEMLLPCLRLGDSRHARVEGVLKVMFLPLPSAKAYPTLVLAGESYGTVRLWTIQRPRQRSRQRGALPPSVGSLNAKCTWSIPAFDNSKGGSCAT